MAALDAGQHSRQVVCLQEASMAMAKCGGFARQAKQKGYTGFQCAAPPEEGRWGGVVTLLPTRKPHGVLAFSVFQLDSRVQGLGFLEGCLRGCRSRVSKRVL